jgi:hypothetical protein
MGHLTQPSSTQAHRVRSARSAWRLAPVALGTAAVLAGCGAGGHAATPRIAASSANAHPASAKHAPGVTVSPAHRTRHAAASSAHRARHVAASPAHHARHVAVSPAHHARHAAASSAHRARHATVSPAHAAVAISQAAVTGQGGAGPQVTVQPSSAKRSDARTATTRPGATIRVITGTHNAAIGTLAERTSVFLVWTASEGPIQIVTSQGNLLLNSHARSGTIRLAAGTYGGLRVASPGAWTLRLHAAV